MLKFGGHWSKKSPINPSQKGILPNHKSIVYVHTLLTLQATLEFKFLCHHTPPKLDNFNGDQAVH